MMKFAPETDFKIVCTQPDVHILPIRPVEADSIVVKMLRTVLCSSHDGVPLKRKNENGRPEFKIIY